MARPLVFGKIKIDYTCSGGGASLAVRTEEPSGALADRATKVLPDAAARGPLTISLPGNITGKLLQVRVTPTGGAKLFLYGISVWAKVLNAGSSWQWYPISGIQPTTDNILTIPFPLPGPSDEIGKAVFPIPEPTDALVPVSFPMPAPSDEIVSVGIGLGLPEFRWLEVPVTER